MIFRQSVPRPVSTQRLQVLLCSVCPAAVRQILRNVIGDPSMLVSPNQLQLSPQSRHAGGHRSSAQSDSRHGSSSEQSTWLPSLTRSFFPQLCEGGLCRRETRRRHASTRNYHDRAPCVDRHRRHPGCNCTSGNSVRTRVSTASAVPKQPPTDTHCHSVSSHGSRGFTVILQWIGTQLSAGGMESLSHAFLASTAVTVHRTNCVARAGQMGCSGNRTGEFVCRTGGRADVYLSEWW